MRFFDDLDKNLANFNIKKIFEILDICISSVNKTIAVIGIAAGTLLAFANVIMRYIFDSGWTWAGEMTNYLFIWSAFFAAAYGFNKGIHVSVTILVEKFPPILAKICLVFSYLLTTVFLIFIAVYAIEYLQILHELEQMIIDLGILQWIPMVVLPVAFLTASYRAAEKALKVALTPANEVATNEEKELALGSVVKK